MFRVLLGDFGGGALLGSDSITFVRDSLDGSLVGIVTVLSSGKSASGSWTFDESSWWSARLVRALTVALDGQGVVVGKLDLNILLIDAWEFAVEFVVGADLLDVKLGVEGLYLAAVVASTNVALRIVVKVIKKTEEWVEGGVGGRGESGEVVERHVASRC